MRALVLTTVVSLGVCVAACGKPPPPPMASAPAAEPAEPAPRPATEKPAAGPPLVAYVETPDPASAPTAEQLAASPAAPGEPPEYTTLKARALRGDTSSRLFKDLQHLGSKYPSYVEIPYLLGQLYFTKLWVADGLKAFRRAIALDPAYRSHPYLLRSAISGLGNDRDSGQVRAFLLRDIGAPAEPYLEEVLYSDYRQQVKDRAVAILRELK